MTIDKNTQSCPYGSWPIAFSNKKTDSHFDYTSSLQNVTVFDNRGMFIDGCKARLEYGVDDIVITDQDGYLAASINGAPFEEAIPGVFVSNTEHMLFNDCVEYADNCLAYCPSICLRTVTYLVEQYETENVNLLVTAGNTCLVLFRVYEFF